ncbi:putative integral membrane sensor protein [Crinalium epipsammum PCC 9333]|uniref:Putative integral membrane sensor protein n=1 Tax=Crinalium epipsammum PCC 9333 TaxID=1173022 RepID=K9VYV8_9CYAN|nr:putative integral membrane sensor protein [Crinalium epipsammum PCC 9333]
MVVKYDFVLVIFSIIIAIFASYTTLELTGRMTPKNGKNIRLGWLIGGSLTMGTGIWAMHFIAMLAYHLPVSIGYDFPIVILSWVAAVIASGIAFYSLHRGFAHWFSLLIPGILMGSGIGSMHYIGMAAMRVPAKMHFNYSIVGLSVLVAVTGSIAALLIVEYLQKKPERELLKLASAVLMGGVISGMHYTGMAAANFTEIDQAIASLPMLEDTTLQYMTGVVSILILGIAILASLNDQKRELLTTILELKQTQTRLAVSETEILRMGAELNVARQMQQMILPNADELEIDGLDLAGYMDAADEVGGDYYDVLNTDGIVTLGIGDVTGHGLESGILMLMAQTAVRTLNEIRELDPVRFLDVINRTLYKNVQRMNSDKSLTLAILNYSQGRVSISGQHEETIIVRQGGEIERVDMMDLGLPIALDDDIVDFINHISIELHPGDGVVLYTDGIPEAKDINKKQYGVEQMCEIISQNWHFSAQEIKQAVIDDLRRHIGTQKVFDDITLLVLKRTEVGVEKESQPQALALV